MSVATAIFNNVFSWRLEGEVDLSAAAAVLAVRGDNMTVTRTGPGSYSVVVKNSGALQLVESLNREAAFCGGFPATASGVTMTTVTQSVTTGDITILLVTTAAPTNGAATDTTAATTIAFGATIRIGKVNSPI